MSVVQSFLDRVFFTTTHVVKVTGAGDRFRLIDLEGEALTRARVGHGDKIQVRAAGLALRTYTPIAWDQARGRVRIVAFVHGHGGGPGTAWARAVREGEGCAFFGPRRSTDLAKARGPVVLFGDETSIGVGASLRELAGKRAELVFEATKARDVAPALDALTVANAHVFERSDGDTHLRAASEHIASLVKDSKDATIVFTGRAKSIAALRSHLRAANVDVAMKAKAYWAEGRTGMD